MWKVHRETNHDFILNLSREFDKLAKSQPRQFPTLFGNSILVASDYSGGRKDSSYYVVSVLIVDFDYAVTWDSRRRVIRADQLGDHRRISFKSLGDRRRASAIAQFLGRTTI